MKWSETVADYYPVDPRPRWGHGAPRHRALHDVLNQGRVRYSDVVDQLAQHRQVLHQIPIRPSSTDPTPFWANGWFTALDAASLVSFVLTRKPQRYMEIGSGYSTLFCRHAVKVGNLGTSITSIDPRPRAGIDELCDHNIRKPLEGCDLGVFDELQKGDLLFFDGSHRIFTNSDVTVFFLEVLPRIRPGVLIHVHDIFLPDDYPPEWNDRLYSEQYLIAAMLLYGRPGIEIILPNYFVCTDDELGPRVREIFRSPDRGPDIPFLYKTKAASPGASFWFETLEHSQHFQAEALPR